MKIISYVRPWNKEYFNSLATTAFPDAIHDTISDFLNVDSLDFQKKFIQEFKDEKSTSKYEINFDTDDVIMRCRLLRELDRELSANLLQSAWNVLNEIFRIEQPDLIISLTVDSYIIDLLRILSEKYNTKFFGFVVSFIPGYFRLTNRGEFKMLRQPTNEEIEEVWRNLVIKEVPPPYMMKSLHREKLKTTVSNKLKLFTKFFYFKYRRFAHDKYCYHFWMNVLASKQSLFHFPEFLKEDKDWNLNIAEAGIKIYLPLQYIPEATVDYWVQDKKFIKYSETIKELFKKGSSKITWYVKEHPSIIGLREHGFYKIFSENENVIIVPSKTNSREVMKSTDVTLVWTGTAGIEAALLGKPVICLSESYYFLDNANMYILRDTANINKLVEKIIRKEPSISKQDQLRMISHILSGTLKGQFSNPSRSKMKWVNDFTEIEVIAESLRNYYNA